ncbi:MAG: hypothetical protein HGA84_03760, partial [Syntrophobacteraceae bacterium]|nr:hypothetical protein [Syntrophobacteraceae bacterium]
MSQEICSNPVSPLNGRTRTLLPTKHTPNMEPVPLEIVPPDVLAVARQLHDSGFGVWFVGGALRDILLGRHPKDWDLATSAS